MIPNTTILIKHSDVQPDTFTIEAHTGNGDAWFETCLEFDLPAKLETLGQSLRRCQEIKEKEYAVANK